MDKLLLLVYLLAGVVSLCLFALVLLIGGLILIFSQRDIEKRYEFLKNMIYGGFGGIIATILIDLKGSSVLDPYFWILKVPLTLLAIGIFVLLGFLYIYLLDKIFNWIKLNKQQATPKKMVKSIWSKLWDNEDRRLFGELLMILGGFLVVKWADLIVPNFQGKEWLYFAFGFLLILWGIKLIRKEESKDKK